MRQAMLILVHQHIDKPTFFAMFRAPLGPGHNGHSRQQQRAANQDGKPSQAPACHASQRRTQDKHQNHQVIHLRPVQMGPVPVTCQRYKYSIPLRRFPMHMVVA